VRVIEDDMLLESRVRFGELFDVYSSLLTERQRTVCELVINGDLSTSELAGELEVTRQGAYDLVRRSRECLEDIERAVGMLALKSRYEGIMRLIGENGHSLPDDFLSRLGELDTPAKPDKPKIQKHG
jgi:predicted DNA-binding protein YlxM (UPF0122 family)